MSFPLCLVRFQILNQHEQHLLKEGKTFWTWNHKNGSKYNIHYIEEGEGDQHVVLIHGFRGNTYSWRHLIDPIANARLSCLTFDLIGYGFK